MVSSDHRVNNDSSSDSTLLAIARDNFMRSCNFGNRFTLQILLVLLSREIVLQKLGRADETRYTRMVAIYLMRSIS